MVSKAKLKRIKDKLQPTVGEIDPDKWNADIFTYDPLQPEIVKDTYSDKQMTVEEWNKKVEAEENDPNKFNLLIGVAR